MRLNSKTILLLQAVIGLIIIIIAVFLIYRKLDVYTQLQLKKIFSGRNLAIIFFIGGWWLWAKSGEDVTISTATRWMPIFGLLVLAGSQWIGALRYETQQVVTPNFHGSYSKSPIRYNGFYIFAIDSFNAGGLSWDFAKRILIVREETVQFFDRGAVSIAKPTRVSGYELGDEIMNMIRDDKFLKTGMNEIYYGWFDDLNRVDYDFAQLKQLKEYKKEIEH